MGQKDTEAIEEDLETLDEADIEARSKLYTDAIDLDHQGMKRIKYQYIFKGVLKRKNNVKSKKVVKEARYDTEDDRIEWRHSYYLDGELIAELDDWSGIANVDPDGRFTESGSATVSHDGATNIIEGDNVKEAIEKYLKWEFFTDPEAELGEIYYEVTGVK